MMGEKRTWTWFTGYEPVEDDAMSIVCAAPPEVSKSWDGDRMEFEDGALSRDAFEQLPQVFFVDRADSIEEYDPPPMVDNLPSASTTYQASVDMSDLIVSYDHASDEAKSQDFDDDDRYDAVSVLVNPTSGELQVLCQEEHPGFLVSVKASDGETRYLVSSNRP